MTVTFKASEKDITALFDPAGVQWARFFVAFKNCRAQGDEETEFRLETRDGVETGTVEIIP